MDRPEKVRQFADDKILLQWTRAIAPFLFEGWKGQS